MDGSSHGAPRCSNVQYPGATLVICCGWCGVQLGAQYRLEVLHVLKFEVGGVVKVVVGAFRPVYPQGYSVPVNVRGELYS